MDIDNPETLTCDRCEKKWMKGDLFICPKCGCQFCMICSFKGKVSQSILLEEMSTCPECKYVISEDDRLSDEEYRKLRAKRKSNAKDSMVRK